MLFCRNRVALDARENTLTRGGGARKSGDAEYEGQIKAMGTQIWKKEEDRIEVRKCIKRNIKYFRWTFNGYYSSRKLNARYICALNIP